MTFLALTPAEIGVKQKYLVEKYNYICRNFLHLPKKIQPNQSKIPKKIIFDTLQQNSHNPDGLQRFSILYLSSSDKHKFILIFQVHLGLFQARHVLTNNFRRWPKLGTCFFS